MNRIILVAMLALSHPLFAQSLDKSEPHVALVGGRLIDGRPGTVIQNSVVLLRGTKIEAVGTVGALSVPNGYAVISTEGMTVLPGLWDMHTHLQYSAHSDLNAWNNRYLPQMETVIMPAIASQLLMAGITSARDLMAPLDQIVHTRDRIARGEIPGPTLYVAGALLEHEAPPGTEQFRWSVKGTDDARKKVDRLAAAHVDIIKLLCVPAMSQEEANAVVAQAHSHGLMVAAHGRTDEEIRKCLTAGVDDFQHLGTLALLPDDIVMMIRQRVAQRRLLWTPTVGSPINYTYLLRDMEMLDDPAWHRGLPESIVDDIRNSLPAIPRVIAGLPMLVASDEALYRRKFEQLVHNGVEILPGTDTGNPGHFHPFGLWLELDAWVNHFGVDPMEAIRRATSYSAEVMGAAKDYGTVEPGKFADLIVVHGDPRRHIDLLRDPVVIIKHGQRVK
jgi:imidazolonepropionase-like amidohydrolase